MRVQYKSITNLKTYLVALLAFLLGCGLLGTSQIETFKQSYPVISMIMANFGSLFIASVSVALMWDLFSKRAFLDELLANTGLAESIRLSGLSGITLSPIKGVNFSSLISKSDCLDMFVCYAGTWRGNYEEELLQLARRPKAKVRLIIPNPENDTLMEALDKRFGFEMDGEESRKRIEGAISECKLIFNSKDNPGIDFSIWVHDETPVFSFYKFDQCSTFTMYKHSVGRTHVPTLVAEKDGELYDFIEREIEAMIEGISEKPALARKIFPNKPNQVDS